MGSSTDPSRIFPGKKQAGHMGVDQVTVQNLDVVKVDAELNLIAIRGAVPGPKGSIVYIKDTVKVQPVKKGDAGQVTLNPQKQSGRGNPQKASARTR
jgi:large subunit ribosomal protein L3